MRRNSSTCQIRPRDRFHFSHEGDDITGQMFRVFASSSSSLVEAGVAAAELPPRAVEPNSVENEKRSDFASEEVSADAADHEEVCAICQESLCGGEGGRATCVSLMGCKHQFHSQCIVYALQFDKRCPLCRFAPQGHEDNDATTTSDEEDEQRTMSAEEERIAAQRSRRRMRAIHKTIASTRSSFLRRSHKSKDEDCNLRQAREAVRAYDRLKQNISTLQKRRATLVRDGNEYRREHNRKVRKIMSDANQYARTEALRWNCLNERLEAQEQKLEDVGNELARYGGWDDDYVS